MGFSVGEPPKVRQLPKTFSRVEVGEVARHLLITYNPPTLDKATTDLIRGAVNGLETITYHKHHYVRKSGLKRVIRAIVAHDRATAPSQANYKKEVK